MNDDYKRIIQSALSKVAQTAQKLTQSAGNAIIQDFNRSPVVRQINYIKQTAPKVTQSPQVKQTLQTVGNQPLFNLPSVPFTPYKPQSPTVKQGFDFTRDTLVRPPLRAAGEVQLTQMTGNNPKVTLTPQPGLGQFLLGDKPLQTYSNPNRPSREFLRGQGLPEQLAPLMIGAGLALDLAPFSPTKAGKQKVVKELEPLIGLARGSRNYDDFVSRLSDYAPTNPTAMASLQANKIKLRDLFNYAVKRIERPISSEGAVAKGGVRINDVPTQTEIENRIQLEMGKPDLYTQRGKKFAEVYGEPYIEKSSPLNNTSWLDTHGTTLDKAKVTRVKNDPVGVTESLPKIIDNTDYNNVKNKVNFFDYVRTPDRVFRKLGLENEAELLRKQYDTYTVELPKELDKITAWAKRAPKENQAIFQYLDGNKGVTLSPEAKQVALEIRDYLKEWATKLKLPRDQQITDYITHIFPKGMVQKEFDPEIAKLIRGKVVGSVYDPFLQKRSGKPEYLQDTWAAVAAYSKRAVRKFYMDPALARVQAKADALPEESYNYIKQNISHINMQPTQLDNLLDNAIKSTPIGYRLGQRPIASTTQGARQMVFRGLLGLNIGSALRNLQQSTNTYAVLGEKYLLMGAIKAIQNLPRFLSGADTELHRVGVLGKDIAGIDRTINPTKKFWENTDKVLFYMFNQAENINRSIAFFGAKAKALSKGMNEDEAIDYAKQIVRQTQFNYDVIDLPVALQSDIAKTIFQFAKYPLAQTEFLAEMLKRKDVIGSVRFIGANLLFIGTLGQLLGLEPKDIFPQYKFGVPPTLQLPVEIGKAVTNAPDQWGNEQDATDKAINITKAGGNYIPGFTQGLKTFQGIESVGRGYDASRQGRVKFPIEQTNENLIRAALFGKYNLPEAKAYRENDRSTLGEEQTKEFIESTDRQKTYDEIMQDRAVEARDTQIKDALKNSEYAYTQENGKFYVKQRDGDVKIIDLSKPVEKPTFTGSELVDTQSLEKYRDSLGTRINNIYDLATIGAVPKDVAVQQMTAILNAQNQVRQALSPKYVKPKTLEDIVISNAQSSLTSEANEIYKKLQEGTISVADAEAQLANLRIKEESLKKPRGGGGGRKFKLKTYKGGSKATSGKIKLAKGKKPKKFKVKKLAKLKVKRVSMPKIA